MTNEATQPHQRQGNTPENEIATLGGGCFWCLEGALTQLAGIHSILPGYAGGHVDNPDYDSVCSGKTGHAEVIQARFDPAVIDYRTILDAFFTIHDPTTLNRQGNDVGTQYRSVIFTHDSRQEATAKALIAELTAAHIWPDPIVTAVLPAPTFWPAENYHRDYFAKHPEQPYCQIVTHHKVIKLRQAFASRLKK